MRRHIHVHVYVGDGAPTTLAAKYADLLERMWACLKARTTHDAWAENKHPRASDGRFGSKAGQSTSKPDEAKGGPSGKGALRAVLESGKPFTKEQLMQATGIESERTLMGYLADLKNPKYAGKAGALSIARNADGTFQVVQSDGKPAPAPTQTPAPAASPAPSPSPAPAAPAQGERVEKAREALATALKKHDKLGEFDYPIAAVSVASGGGSILVSPPSVGDTTRAFGDTERAAIVEQGQALGLKEVPLEYGARGTMVVFAVAAAEKKKAPDHWVPAKTTKEATERAVSEGYLDAAEFGRMPVERANEIMSSVAAHMSEFPGLHTMGHWFSGTNAGWKKEAVRKQTEAWTAALKLKHPEMSAEDLARNVSWRSRAPRISTKAWATAWRMGTAPGQQDMRAVVFNETFTTKSTMQDELTRSTNAKWHPPACDTLKSVMDHELGHQLDYLLGLRANPEVTQLYAATRRREGGIAEHVSRYGNTNVAEFIAESWAEYRNNPQPREVAKKMGQIVKEAYARQFQKEAA